MIENKIFRILFYNYTKYFIIIKRKEETILSFNFSKIKDNSIHHPLCIIPVFIKTSINFKTWNETNYFKTWNETTYLRK